MGASFKLTVQKIINQKSLDEVLTNGLRVHNCNLPAVAIEVLTPLKSGFFPGRTLIIAKTRKSELKRYYLAYS